jgi:hypothetical protein
MKSLPCLLAVCAVVLAVAAPVLAAPPPLPVAVAFAGMDIVETGDRPEALRRALVADGWFADTPSDLLADPAIAHCPVHMLETCLRAAVAGRKGRRPVDVLILLEAGGEGRTRLTCVGSAPPADEPTAEIDLANPSVEDRTAAARCIIAAAAQSGW